MKLALALTGAALTITGPVFAQGSDDCANAQVINGLGSHNFDNTSATTDGPSDCLGKLAHRDVWFRWTAPQTGGYIISTCLQTSLSARIIVYDFQSCPVSMVPVGCKAGGCPSGPQARFSFPTVGGQDYLIRLGSRFSTDSGSGTFTLEFDNCWNLPDDALEDNEPCDQARPMDNGVFPGLLVLKLDPDWYVMDVADGATLTCDVFFTHSNGDIDIALYNGCGGGQLAIGGTATDDEQVIWTNSTGACVKAVLGVNHWPPDPKAECNTYSLQIQGAAAIGTCGPGGIGTIYCDPAEDNSTGLPGVMSAAGSVLVADNDVTLTASQLPNNQFGYFLTSMDQGLIMNPGGSDGNLCLMGAIGRYNRAGEVMSSGGTGSFSLVLDLTDTPQPAGPVSILAGESWNFTSWFRDNTMGGSNFTDGLQIVFQ